VGHAQAAGIVRYLGYRHSDDTTSGEGSAVGWGAHASGVAKLGSGFPNATFRLSAVYGRGIANYMNDGGVDLAPTSSGRFDAVPLLGVVYFLDFSLTESCGASLGYSFTAVDNTSGQTSDAFRRGDYASFTLLYSPLSNVLTGASYTWGRRVDNDGESGVDQRAQVSVKYSFSSLVKP
jgi:hypothetical protein